MDHHALNRATSITEEYVSNGIEVCDTSDNEYCSVVEEEVVEAAVNSSQNEVQQVPLTSVLDDTPKQSYASIVSL